MKLPAMTQKHDLDHSTCNAHHQGIRDTMDILSGKWKMRILGALSFGKMRFMELISSVDGIAAKMLSKELQELELNGLVKRTVMNTKPITVEYELTEYGHSLKPVIEVIATWGMAHRQRLIGEMKAKRRKHESLNA